MPVTIAAAVSVFIAAAPTNQQAFESNQLHDD
jgi:hypothetical protein